MVKKLMLLAMAVLVAGSWSAPNALGSDGHLDAGFGKGGELVLGSPAERGEPVLLPDGRLLLLEGDRILALLPSGEIDDGFGEVGSAPFFLPPEAAGGGIAVVLPDDSGRLIVVGTCRFPDTGPPQGELEDSHLEVLVERLTPSGQLDRSFGGGDGMFLSSFGLPPAEPGLPPQVRAEVAVLDPFGRIVITGSRGAGVEQVKYGHLQRGREPFVARLTAEGEVDRSFAGDGVLVSPGQDNAYGLAVDGQGDIVAPYLHGVRLTLLRLLGDGAPDPGFGENGFRRVSRFQRGGAGGPGVLGIDPRGEVVVDKNVQGDWEHHLQNGIGIKRIQPDGRLDRALGHDGTVTARFPRLFYSREALDSQGRVVVAMVLRGQTHGERFAGGIAGIALARLRANGQRDRAFGRGGILPIPFNGERLVGLNDLIVAGDRALLEMSVGCKPTCRTDLIQVDLGPQPSRRP